MAEAPPPCVAPLHLEPLPYELVAPILLRLSLVDAFKRSAHAGACFAPARAGTALLAELHVDAAHAELDAAGVTLAAGVLGLLRRAATRWDASR